MSDVFEYGKRRPTPPSVQRPNLQGSNLGRVLPRQNSSSFTRGLLSVGQGGTTLNGADNVITVGNTIILDGNNSVITVSDSSSGEQGLGQIPGETDQAGFFQTDATGAVVYKLVNGTTYVYNAADNYVNTILIGFAPSDGRPGIWVAKPTLSAEELLA